MAVQFGSFVLDVARRELRRDGAAVHLTPKAFDLLRLLVTEAPRVVTKTELHERLWPGTFVSDATLVGLVKEVRRAVDDRDPASPVIRTAHRVGYAFCLDVRAAPGPSAPAGPASSPASHWLVVPGRRLALHEGENVVGRDPASDVWLDAAGVSRRHAQIVVRGAAEVEERQELGLVGLTLPRAVVHVPLLMRERACKLQQCSGVGTARLAKGFRRRDHVNRRGVTARVLRARVGGAGGPVRVLARSREVDGGEPERRSREGTGGEPGE
jgi:DNA-binding winged helix-turn-helix (wHTH) protein